MIVAGSMIGSGIFLVTAQMTRELGSTGWLLASWAITAFLTLAAALSYGELAAMMPWAGGQYVYLREAFSPLAGFLYGSRRTSSTRSTTSSSNAAGRWFPRKRCSFGGPR